MSLYSKGIKEIGSLTERKSAGWCRLESMKYYCNRDFEEINVIPSWIYMRFLEGKEFDNFCEEQINFYDDTMVFVIY